MRPQLSLAGILFAVALGTVLGNNTYLLDRGDGTVLDRRSGLIWQKCSRGQTYNGDSCESPAVGIPWRGAAEYCSRLRLAGKRWRLPDIQELESLVDDSRKNPYINLDMFPGTVPYEYWSSSTFVDHQGVWIYVYSFQRAYKFGVRGGRYLVRCVSDSR